MGKAPVSASDDICGFVNKHSSLNLKADPVNGFTGSSNSETASLTLLNEQEVLGKHFRVYGTIDNPLFFSKRCSRVDRTFSTICDVKINR